MARLAASDPDGTPPPPAAGRRAPRATVVEGGIAKFPAGRTPDEARARRFIAS